MKSVDLNAINPPPQTRTQRAGPVRQQGSAPARPATVSRGTDQIRVSDTATQVATMVARAKSAPAVRQERIESLREAVHSGRYQVSASDIADAIVRIEK